MSTVTPKKGGLIARIKAEPLPDRYARGWHCLGLAQDYKDGKPHTLNIFGIKLVAFQGEDGNVAILDGYCPHMGADLGLGCVEGNSVVCAFHHWKWGADGVCKDIPYAKRIPPKARLKAWPVLEENKLLFVYHDPEENPPPAEVTIPRMNACFSEEWSDWQIVNWTINTNCRELVDNLVDIAHFGPVHGAPVSYWCNTFEGHVGYQYQEGTSATLTESLLTADNAYFGPAYHITYMSGEVDGYPVESILLNCHTPIDQNSFELRFGVIIKKNPALTDEQNEQVAATYVLATQDAFRQDVAIWDTKTRVDNPLVCDGDGPVYQLREWYSQFYQDVAELPSSLREPSIYEWRGEKGVWHPSAEKPARAASKLLEI